MTPEPALAPPALKIDDENPPGTADASTPAVASRARRRDLMGPRTDLAVGWIVLAIVALGTWEWAGRRWTTSRRSPRTQAREGRTPEPPRVRRRTPDRTTLSDRTARNPVREVSSPRSDPA